MRKILLFLISFMFAIGTISCTPKLEDKTTVANYANMKKGKFDAKYTYLDNVVVDRYTDCDLYPDYMCSIVSKEGASERFYIVDLDRKKEQYGYITSSLGSDISNKTINIKKAEVVAESLSKKYLFPILLVHEADLEYPKDKQIEEKLASGKPYSELNIYYDMEYIENGKLGYDKNKYSERVQELLEEYGKEKEKKHSKYADELNSITHNESYNNTFKARFGDFLECNVNGSTAVVKFKIQPSTSNKTTIDQNGYNIEDMILNQGADKYDEIQYWAVADMTDGSESKVISFTVDKDLISMIKNKQIVGNQIVDYGKDLWILPSLK